MKRVLPILIFLFAAVSSSAQNWNVFDPGSRNFYINNYNYLKGMRIDSIVGYGVDMHYYPFRTGRTDVYAGFSADDTTGSWLGGDVIRKPDGVFLFPNHWNDTIVVKSLAGVGDSWVFYQDTSNIYYTAEVTAIDTMTMLGYIDSVKKILLTAYDNGIPLTTDSFNNVEIILSQTHGFHTIIDLYYFPYHAPGSASIVDDYFFINSQKSATLGGLVMIPTAAGPYGGLFRLVEFVNPSYAELNDWNVGDRFQYYGCAVSSGTTSGCTNANMVWGDSIIAKTVTTSGVEYISYKSSTITDTLFFSDSTYLFDTYYMPEEFMGMLTYFELKYYFPQDTGFCHTNALYYQYWYTWAISYFQGYSINKTGIGLLHSNTYESTMSPMVSDSKLGYSHKNGVPCGTPIVIPVSTEDIVGSSTVGIYPNPANEELRVDMPASGYLLSMVNTLGQVVFVKEQCAGKERIDVKGLMNGVYYLRIETPEHELMNRKVVVQR